MRILLTNDDGINAVGLQVLERIAATISDDVWVVAPETEQSGASHSLTLHNPVRVRKLGEKRYAVSGTPTDSVLLGLKEIIKGNVDLVLSGVNRGGNAGDDITYSGTVAGAMEAVMLEVPAIALSQLCDDREQIYWETAEKYAPGLIKKLLEKGWPISSFINLNFPDCAPDKVKGVRACPQGKRRMSVNLTGRVDPKKRPYFWIGGERDNTTERKDVDVAFLFDDYVTVTPIGMDFTDYKTLDALKALNVS